MEPHPTSNILKLCNEFSGFTHLTPARPFGGGSSSSPLISVPRSHADHPTDTIPTSSLSDIHALILTCLPHLQDKPLINQAMCWCTDMPDARWLLCEHPRWRNLVLATGDSGHTFKMLPVVGREVVDLIEGKVSRVGGSVIG
jgi:sarcosine oxidase/sarcosine oxidase/L-pipecolate oxidase